MKSFVATFFDHYGAVQFRTWCKQQDLNCVLQPVPRSLSSSCGTCAVFEASAWKTGYDPHQIEAIYEQQEGAYALLFRNED
ncbi:MAG: DUF3343 domain-containing protein [Spirochaetia bacterium]|nr:DUF3343 domain-containing protein [Spirochaetia bacterium]